MRRPDEATRAPDATGATDATEEPGEEARFPRVIWIGRLRLTPLELAAVLGGLAVFGNLGWDSPLWDGRLQLLLHLLAIAAIGAGIIGLLRGASFPRTGLELPILGLLALLGLASILGQNTGLAARATAASLAFAALLPIAMVAVRGRPALVAAVVIVPTLLLAASVLWQLVARRVGWFDLGLGGLPPVRIASETTAFGSVAVPPFILLGLLPLCQLIAPGRLRTLAVASTVALLVPLGILSGSRSAWLAIGVAAVVFLGPQLLHGRWRRALASGAWRAALAGIGLVAFGLVVAYLVPRLTAITSLLYRERLWRDTLAVWSAHPILGIGPGTMSFARQAAAAPGLPPVRQPHSHDLALGVLGDSGLLGLAAAIALVVVFIWIAGPHRSRTAAGRGASAVLIGFVVAGLFEDLTFLPNFDLMVLLLAAIALVDAGAVRWVPVRLPRAAPALVAVAATGLLVIALLGDAASSAYRLGIESAWAGRWADATSWFQAAISLDPSHPSGPKALAIAADMAGEPSLALDAAREAVRLNPGDGASWTNLAVLCLASGDVGCTRGAVAGTERRAGTTGNELINAGLIEQQLGDDAEADRLYGLSLLTNRNTALATRWPRPVTPPFGEVDTTADANPDLTALLADAAIHRTPAVPADASQSVRALAFAMRGDRSGAEQSLSAAMHDETADALTWEIAAVLKRHWGEDVTAVTRIAAFLRGSTLSFSASGIPQVTYDVAAFHISPRDMLVRGATRLIPVPPWPWALERFLPAE
jgi:putative inorganic carbon (hco3(-)) transporter